MPRLCAGTPSALARFFHRTSKSITGCLARPRLQTRQRRLALLGEGTEYLHPRGGSPPRCTALQWSYRRDEREIYGTAATEAEGGGLGRSKLDSLFFFFFLLTLLLFPPSHNFRRIGAGRPQIDGSGAVHRFFRYFTHACDLIIEHGNGAIHPFCYFIYCMQPVWQWGNPFFFFFVSSLLQASWQYHSSLSPPLPRVTVMLWLPHPPCPNR